MRMKDGDSWYLTLRGWAQMLWSSGPKLLMSLGQYYLTMASFSRFFVTRPKYGCSTLLA